MILIDIVEQRSVRFQARIGANCPEFLSQSEIEKFNNAGLINQLRVISGFVCVMRRIWTNISQKTFLDCDHKSPRLSCQGYHVIFNQGACSTNHKQPMQTKPLQNMNEIQSKLYSHNNTFIQEF